MYFLSVLHVQPISKVHLTVFESFCASLLLFSFLVGHFFYHSAAPNCFFQCFTFTLRHFHFLFSGLSIISRRVHSSYTSSPSSKGGKTIFPFSPYSILFSFFSHFSFLPAFLAFLFSSRPKIFLVKSLHPFLHPLFFLRRFRCSFLLFFFFFLLLFHFSFFPAPSSRHLSRGRLPPPPFSFSFE